MSTFDRNACCLPHSKPWLYRIVVFSRWMVRHFVDIGTKNDLRSSESRFKNCFNFNDLNNGAGDGIQTRDLRLGKANHSLFQALKITQFHKQKHRVTSALELGRFRWFSALFGHCPDIFRTDFFLREQHRRPQMPTNSCHIYLTYVIHI
jgi:hypothetical protein